MIATRFRLMTSATPGSPKTATSAPQPEWTRMPIAVFFILSMIGNADARIVRLTIRHKVFMAFTIEAGQGYGQHRFAATAHHQSSHQGRGAHWSRHGAEKVST